MASPSSMSTAAPNQFAPREASSENSSWEFEVLFDGGCPLCLREINLLRWLDRANKLQFTDIAAADFSPQREGKAMATLMAEIHGRLPDGTWVVGADVFRHLYAAVGFRRLVAITRWPGIRQTLDAGYRLFAKYRLPLTGRRCEPDGTCRIEASAQIEPGGRSSC